MKTTIIDWLKVLILLLDEAAVLVIVFVVLYFVGVRIPLAVTIILGFIIAVLVLIVHIKVIPSFHWKKVTGREGMIGMQCRVIKPLTPVGTVFINGENWKAKSENEDIELNENVEVVAIEGLTLKVVRSTEV
ncbi:NfeD family protein [Chloroflexota bacterium]